MYEYWVILASWPTEANVRMKTQIERFCVCECMRAAFLCWTCSGKDIFVHLCIIQMRSNTTSYVAARHIHGDIQLCAQIQARQTKYAFFPWCFSEFLLLHVFLEFVFFYFSIFFPPLGADAIKSWPMHWLLSVAHNVFSGSYSSVMTLINILCSAFFSAL